MKLKIPFSPVHLLLVTFAGFGLGLMIGAIWQGQTEITELLVGFSLIVACVVVFLYSEIGPL